MKKKQCKNYSYWIMMGVGILLTLLLFLNDCVYGCWKQVVNILAMLGSGIFCSAIVSYRVEKNNKKMAKEEKERQREYFFHSVKWNIKRLIKKELIKLLDYFALTYGNGELVNKRQKFSIKQICNKIINYLENLIKIEESRRNENLIKIDLKEIQRRELKEKLIYKESLTEYENVFKCLNRILSEANNYYIAGIFDEKVIDILGRMEIDAEMILNCTNVENGIACKLEFYKDMSKYMEALNIDVDEQLEFVVKEPKLNEM